MRLTDYKRRFSFYSYVFVEFCCGGSLSAGGVDGCHILYVARVYGVLGHLRKIAVAVAVVVGVIVDDTEKPYLPIISKLYHGLLWLFLVFVS